MDAEKRKRWRDKLLRPSPSHSVLALLGLGLVLGVLAMIAFDTTLHATSTEEFCISCHEMKAHPYAQLQKTAHYDNAFGVRATCSDCHVPKEFVPKMIRKVEAAREVWGTITGVIDTPEKYAAHTPVMKDHHLRKVCLDNRPPYQLK
jgi:cytochrome c-type protein NapC